MVAHTLGRYPLNLRGRHIILAVVKTRMGPDWTGPDRTGPDRTGPDQPEVVISVSTCRETTAHHDPGDPFGFGPILSSVTCFIHVPYQLVLEPLILNFKLDELTSVIKYEMESLVDKFGHRSCGSVKITIRPRGCDVIHDCVIVIVIICFYVQQLHMKYVERTVASFPVPRPAFVACSTITASDKKLGVGLGTRLRWMLTNDRKILEWPSDWLTVDKIAGELCMTATPFIVACPGRVYS